MLFACLASDRCSIINKKHLAWVFIGNERSLDGVKSILEGNKRVYIGRDLAGLSEDLRDNFISFIGCLSRQQKNRVMWYSYRFASKSVSQTFIFQRYIYLMLLLKYSEKHNDVLFITDDKELLHQLSLINYKDIRVNTKINDWLDRVNGQVASCRFIFNIIINYLIQKIVKRHGIRERDVLIHSWIDERVFQNVPSYQDSYFSGLEAHLSKSGMSVGRITPLRVSPKHTLWIKRMFSNVYNPLSYLNVWRFMKCLFTRPKISLRLDQRSNIAHKDILLNLARSEFEVEKRKRVYKEYHLYYESYFSMCKAMNNTAVIIYPFENQPWEKMLLLAITNHRRIAYQHCPIPRNWLDYYTNDEEKDAPVPDTILAMGDKWLQMLQEMYGKRVHVDMAGALRFEHIYRRDRKCCDYVKSECRDIVVALPIIEGHAIALQDRLMDCFRKNLFNGYRVYIKPHPYLFDNALRKELWITHDDCFRTDEDISELLKKCSLLITTGSTVAYEALAEGVNTLYYVPEVLSMGHEYQMNEFMNIAYDDEFSRVLSNVLNELDKEIKFPVERYFSESNYDVFVRNVGGTQ